VVGREKIEGVRDTKGKGAGVQQGRGKGKQMKESCRTSEAGKKKDWGYWGKGNLGLHEAGGDQEGNGNSGSRKMRR